MSRPVKFIIRLALAIVAILLVLVLSIAIVIQTPWFANYLREHLVTYVEQATGGQTTIASLAIDFRNLTATVRELMIHGKEPSGSAPFFVAPMIQVRVSFFSHRKIFNVEQLAINHPAVNIMVFADGESNLPTPAKQSNSNLSSDVNQSISLAVRQFDLTDGQITFADHTIPLSVHLHDLVTDLRFTPESEYTGNILASIVLNDRSRLTARLAIPLVLRRGGVVLTHASLETPLSRIITSAEVYDLRSVHLSAQVDAHVALSELRAPLAIPIHPEPGLPDAIDLHATFDAGRNAISIQEANLRLGTSQIEAATSGRVTSFHGSVSLDEIRRLLEMPNVPPGVLRMSGEARLKLPNYSVQGSLNATALPLPYPELGRADLSSAFRIEPSLITIPKFHVDALQSALSGSASIRDFKNIDATAEIQRLNLSRAVEMFSGKTIGYSGALSSSFTVRGPLRAPDVVARMSISPDGAGVPLQGEINATYSADTKTLVLSDSSIHLPHSILELGGTPGVEAHMTFQSRNVVDLSPLLSFFSHSRNLLESGSGLVELAVRGPLDRALVSGSVRLTAFNLDGRRFDDLSTQFTASPNGAEVTNGSLDHGASHARFSGSIGLSEWSPHPSDPINANLDVDHGQVSDFLLLAGLTSVHADGEVTGSMHATGSIGNPQGNVGLSILNGRYEQERFTNASLKATLSDRLINLISLSVAGPAGALEAHGSLRHPSGSVLSGAVQAQVSSSGVDLSRIETLQAIHRGLGGEVQWNFSAAGELSRSAGELGWSVASVNGSLKASGIRDNHDSLGDLTLAAQTRGQDANVSLVSSIADSSTQVRGSVHLAEKFPFTADVSVTHLNVQKLASLVRVPSITGISNLQAHLTGTPQEPRAAATVQLTNGAIFGQQVSQLTAAADYTNTLLTLSSARIVTPAGRADLSGSFSHLPSSFTEGRVAVHVAMPGLSLSRLSYIHDTRPGLDGIVSLTADASVDLHGLKFSPVSLDASGGIRNVTLNREPLGSLAFKAQTRNGAIATEVHSDLLRNRFEGNVEVDLKPNYPTRAQLTFSGLTYGGIRKLLNLSELPMEASADGSLGFEGPLLAPEQARGQLQLSKLEITSANEIKFTNSGPITVNLDRTSVATINGRMTGPSADLVVSGTVPLNKTNSMAVSLTANADLGMLKTFFPGSVAAGILDVNATARGTLAAPQLGGRVQLDKASFQLADWPNGIYNANAVLLLTGNGGQIQSFTAESGGGKVNLTGFFGYTNARLNYNLHADARQVRTHYVGASITASAALTLSGTNTNGLLNGTVTISRVGYGQQSDIGSILSSATKPPGPPSASTGPLSAIQAHVRIQTASNVLFQTTLAEQLSATADLTLIGSLANPGMVGRITINSGTLVFFSNKYSVNRGTISFYDPATIQPVLDIDLETIAQGVDVNLTVSGPMDNLKLSYRSDPPLRFEDIVALLAAGKTPPDATIAASQPLAPDQSAMQMGESALLGAAIANPVASRLQRVFGVNQLTIAPTFVSGTALPQARFTLQQEVVQNVTLTYSQDVSQANAELIRIEWALNPRFSAVATRDENGVFSIDVFWKKQFR